MEKNIASELVVTSLNEKINRLKDKKGKKKKLNSLLIKRVINQDGDYVLFRNPTLIDKQKFFSIPVVAGLFNFYKSADVMAKEENVESLKTLIDESGLKLAELHNDFLSILTTYSLTLISRTRDLKIGEEDLISNEELVKDISNEILDTIPSDIKAYREVWGEYISGSLSHTTFMKKLATAMNNASVDPMDVFEDIFCIVEIEEAMLFLSDIFSEDKVSASMSFFEDVNDIKSFF